MKTKFTTDANGRVTLAYEYDDCVDGLVRVERVFTCPVDGGYVREHRHDGEWVQVCDRLNSAGNTLHCGSRDKLLEMIRHEYKAMRREEKRETFGNA